MRVYTLLNPDQALFPTCSDSAHTSLRAPREVRPPAPVHQQPGSPEEDWESGKSLQGLTKAFSLPAPPRPRADSRKPLSLGEPDTGAETPPYQCCPHFRSHPSPSPSQVSLPIIRVKIQSSIPTWALLRIKGDALNNYARKREVNRMLLPMRAQPPMPRHVCTSYTFVVVTAS